MRKEKTMKLTSVRFRVAATCFLALVLAGGTAAHAQEPVATVPDQVAAALYIQQWGQILWGLVTTQTGTETPSFGDPIFNPDGSVTQSFTTADGTEVTLTAFPDGSARIDIVLPDGSTQTVLQSVPIFDGMSVTTISWSVTSSDGLSVEYVSRVDDRETLFDISDDITELIGSSVLPGGVTQDFDVLTADGFTDVLSTQSDGSTFTLSVPLAFPTFIHPDFTQDAVGSYLGSGFALDFVLRPTPKFPSRWAALLCDLGGGVTGTLSLYSDFAGFGQLTDSGTLVALVVWTQEGETDVYLLNGQDRFMGPSGAALDFLTNRWQTLTALLAPAPGLSTNIGRPHRLPRVPRVGAARPRTLRDASPSPPQAATPRSSR
jgi:hypothetical protein